MIKRQGTNVVDSGCDYDLIEFVPTVSHERDGVAEINSKYSDELLIIHISDLIDVSFERI